LHGNYKIHRHLHGIYDERQTWQGIEELNRISIDDAFKLGNPHTLHAFLKIGARRFESMKFVDTS